MPQHENIYILGDLSFNTGQCVEITLAFKNLYILKAHCGDDVVWDDNPNFDEECKVFDIVPEQYVDWEVIGYNKETKEVEYLVKSVRLF